MTEPPFERHGLAGFEAHLEFLKMLMAGKRVDAVVALGMRIVS